MSGAFYPPEESALRRSDDRQRLLRRFYARKAHSVADVHALTEHRLYLRLVLCPSGGW